MIERLTDYFINPAYHADPKKLRRVRLFVRACLLTSLFSSSYIFMSILFDYPKGIYFMIFNVVGFLLLPLLAKTKLPLKWLGNMYVTIGATAVIALTYFSGGLWSAIYPWIISIPVLALLVVGRFSGIVWGAIALTAMLAFGYLAIIGVVLPEEYNTSLRTEWFVSVLPGLLLIILVVSLVFENTQTTALRSVEEQNVILRTQKETISDQSAKLEKLIEDKDFIIRILAHDLKNPLANINVIANLMRKEDRDEHMNEFIDMISQASTNAQHLVNRVLDMGQLDQGNLKAQLEEVNAHNIVLEVLETMKEPALQKNITINFKKSTASDLVIADHTYLYQILENLLSNALKFSKPGTPVDLELIEDNDRLLIRVMDRGPGVSPNEQDLLFREFSKLSAQPTAGENSTGLGLSLVKRYVDQINGKVWYESRPGGGAMFVVALINRV